MTTHPRLSPLVCAVVTLWTALAVAGQPSGTPPNAAQADVLDGFLCEGPTTDYGPFIDVPGSGLALTTTGNPLLVSFTVNGQQRPQFQISGAGYQLVLVVDGQPQDPVRWQLRLGGAEEASILTASRLLALTPGAHSFSLRMSCKNPWEIINGWLLAYELPTMGK